MIVVGRAGLSGDRSAHAERARRRAGAALDDVAQHAGHLKRDRRADQLLRGRPADRRPAGRRSRRPKSSRAAARPGRRRETSCRRRSDRAARPRRCRARATARRADRSGRRRRPAAAPRAMPTRCCRSAAAALFDSSSAARSVSASGCSPFAARAPLGIARRGDVPQVRQHRHRRVAVRERRGVDERLERRSRLALAAHRAVEGAARVVGAADHREDVAGRRIDRDERRLEARAGAGDRGRRRPRAPPHPGPSGRNAVWTCQSGGLSPPNSLRNCWRRNSLA